MWDITEEVTETKEGEIETFRKNLGNEKAFSQREYKLNFLIKIVFDNLFSFHLIIQTVLASPNKSEYLLGNEVWAYCEVFDAKNNLFVTNYLKIIISYDYLI